MKKRTAFDGLLAVYVAALFAPVVGEIAGLMVYAGTFVCAWIVVYAGVRLGKKRLRRLPGRLARRPTATVVIVFPLVYGVAYIVGAFLAEPPVRSPYVYLGLWSVIVGFVTVAVARETAGVGAYTRER